MLHMEDSSMILQNAANPNSLYHLDIETGKVVDEWKVHDDIPVVNFLPDNVSILCKDLQILFTNMKFDVAYTRSPFFSMISCVLQNHHSKSAIIFYTHILTLSRNFRR